MKKGEIHFELKEFKYKFHCEKCNKDTLKELRNLRGNLKSISTENLFDLIIKKIK